MSNTVINNMSEANGDATLEAMGDDNNEGTHCDTSHQWQKICGLQETSKKSSFVQYMDKKIMSKLREFEQNYFVSKSKWVMNQFVHINCGAKMHFCSNFRLCVNLEKNYTQQLCVL
jgi:hypothetical protein